MQNSFLYERVNFPVLEITYLNTGDSDVMIPTSISCGLKSADSTEDKHVIATWRMKEEKNYSKMGPSNKHIPSTTETYCRTKP